MVQPPFRDVEGTDTDDRAYLLESRSLAILRLAPIFLILMALLVGCLSLWFEPDGDRLIRLAEIVISGSLGSLTSASTQRLRPSQDRKVPPSRGTNDTHRRHDNETLF